MPTLGVAVAILDDHRILLIKREDFEVWALPGGAVDAGESLAQAAVREAREETGLQVSLTRLVGIYSRPHWDHGGDHVLLFAAAPIGGVLLQDSGGEVVDARYFARHELPEALVPWHRQRICDALDGVGGGVAWSHTTVWPFAQGMTPHELYNLRDRSGLSRQQFYDQYLVPTMTEEHLDVGRACGSSGGSERAERKHLQMPQSVTWDEQLQGHDCPLCGPQPEVNDYKFKIASLRISTLYLFRDQRFRGYCLLIFDPCHATNLAQLPQREYGAFMLDLKQTGQALQRALHPDHMNYECLGNSGPHLHWHVIPRYQNDPRWGQPIWEGWQRNEFNINRVVIGDQEYQDLVTSIRTCLHETEV